MSGREIMGKIFPYVPSGLPYCCTNCRRATKRSTSFVQKLLLRVQSCHESASIYVKGFPSSRRRGRLGRTAKLLLISSTLMRSCYMLIASSYRCRCVSRCYDWSTKDISVSRRPSPSRDRPCGGGSVSIVRRFDNPKVR